MSFPFASWEYPYWHSTWLPHMSVQTENHLLQLSVREPAQDVIRYLMGQLHWLFWRSLNSQEEGNFVVTPPSPFQFHEYAPLIRDFGNLSSAQMSIEVEEAIHEGSFARVFFLNEDEQLRGKNEVASYRLLVGARGWGEWKRLETKVEPQPQLRFGRESPRYCESAVFRWTNEPNTARFLSNSALEIWEQIQIQKSDLALECALARRMLDLPLEEVHNFVRRWNQKQHAELYHVLRGAFLSQAELWESSKSYG